MKVITHTIKIGGKTYHVNIAPKHKLPQHSEYLGVLHGLHDGICDCKKCRKFERSI